MHGVVTVSVSGWVGRDTPSECLSWPDSPPLTPTRLYFLSIFSIPVHDLEELEGKIVDKYQKYEFNKIKQ